jgi:ATP-dependent exoDNAse (exonuclease V) beta subunit
MKTKDTDIGLCFPQVIVVEASAGSGKTYELAKRYLQLLINPAFSSDHIPLRGILAITFTNKATVEMKERILEFLKKIALDGFSNKEEEADIFEALGADKPEAKRKALALMDTIIQHYNFFQVQTIDSFVNALLLGCALNIDRSASFVIKKQYAHHLSYCLDLVIEEASTDTDVLHCLEDFLQHYLFVENRKGWFPREDILGLIIALFQLSNKYGKLFREHTGKSQDIIKIKKALFARIGAQIAADFPEGMNKTARKSIENFIEKGDDIFEIRCLPTAFQSGFVPMNKNKKCSSDYQKKWAGIHRDLCRLIELESHVAYNPYVRLFHRLIAFSQLVSKKEDILFLEELNRKARLLFTEEGITLAELYYRLATRFKHYLIDEFQDTSALQWRNLNGMVEEALSSGGSLFYVGDKKQAIYRFRGGEVGLFDSVKHEFSQFNVIPRHLTKNRRSQKEIVEFNNRVFSRENLLKALKNSPISRELESEEARLAIVDIFRDSIQDYKHDYTGGYVRVERIQHKNQKERDEIMRPKLIALLQELRDRDRFKYEDIAILTRDNSEVELITSWFLEEGIPVESEKTLNVAENYLVKEIIALLKFLRSPIDDLCFAAFILGDIFSRASGLTQTRLREFLFRMHKAGFFQDNKALYRAFAEEFSRQWAEYIEPFFQNVGFVSSYELLSAIYQRLGIMENFRESRAFFMKLLELAKTQESEYVGLGEFLEYLGEAPAEDLYVKVTHGASVRILTIHKSKGLEFPVVIIPFLRMDISGETGPWGTKSYVENQADPDISLVRIIKDYLPYSDKLKAIWRRDYQKACIDELNAMYVACTRAEYELYIFIPQRSGAGKNIARFFIPEDIAERGIRQKYVLRKKESQPPLVEIGPSEYRDWIGMLKNEFVKPLEIKNREKILEGTVFHAILARIGNCAGKDAREMLKKAMEAVRIQYPSLENLHIYEEKVQRLMEKEALKDIFYAPGADVFCEKEIANAFGDTKRIDRLILRKNQVWIVDYKSSRSESSADAEQVAEYTEIVKGIYPDRSVRGFLVYLDDLALQEL